MTTITTQTTRQIVFKHAIAQAVEPRVQVLAEIFEAGNVAVLVLNSDNEAAALARGILTVTDHAVCSASPEHCETMAATFEQIGEHALAGWLRSGAPCRLLLTVGSVTLPVRYEAGRGFFIDEPPVPSDEPETVYLRREHYALVTGTTDAWFEHFIGSNLGAAILAAQHGAVELDVRNLVVLLIEPGDPLVAALDAAGFGSCLPVRSPNRCALGYAHRLTVAGLLGPDSNVAEVLATEPDPGCFWLVVAGAGLTRLVCREWPLPLPGQA